MNLESDKTSILITLITIILGLFVYNEYVNNVKKEKDQLKRLRHRQKGSHLGFREDHQNLIGDVNRIKKDAEVAARKLQLN